MDVKSISAMQLGEIVSKGVRPSKSSGLKKADVQVKAAPQDESKPQVAIDNGKVVLALLDNKRVVIQVLNGKGKVIRQIPPEELVAAYDHLQKVIGRRYDKEG